MNRVFLTGRITKDPELRYSSTGIAMLSFSLAVDRMTRDASGNRQADFFNCVAFRSQAEFISRYVKKGNMLAVEGRLQTRTYQAQDGSMRNVVDIMCDQVENLTPRTQNIENQPNPSFNQPSQGSVVSPQSFPNTYQKPSYGSSDDVDTMNVDDDDLPF